MISSSSSSPSSSKDIAPSTTSSSSSSLSGSSPYHRLRHNESAIITIEEGCEDVKKRECEDVKKREGELLRMESDDAFSIPSKNASLEKLRKWRVRWQCSCFQMPKLVLRCEFQTAQYECPP